jgi:transcriptional regulator GlxA family with amidase domain
LRSPRFDGPVPGGRAPGEVDNAASWLGRCGAPAGVASVCTGGAARARQRPRCPRANKSARSLGLRRPGVDWVRKARWVEDGKFITSSGVSAGIDMSLALVGRMVDPETADTVAHMIEYTRRTDPDDDPFA